jgi:hypothetical protein
MGSVDEGDVERQQQEERKEQWAKNIESEQETPPESPAAAAPAPDAAHASETAAANGTQPAQNGSQPVRPDRLPWLLLLAAASRKGFCEREGIL